MSRNEYRNKILAQEKKRVFWRDRFYVVSHPTYGSNWHLPVFHNGMRMYPISLVFNSIST